MEAPESSSGASAHLSQGPPQAVSLPTSLNNASPNGRTDNVVCADQLFGGNDAPSPPKGNGRPTRKGRTSVENLTCTICGKVCSNKNKFMRHQSTHSEERPYTCHLCKKGFKWVEYLNKHLKQQHQVNPMTSSDVTMTTSPPAVTTAATGTIGEPPIVMPTIPTNMEPSVITSTPAVADPTDQPAISKEMYISVIEAVLRSKGVIGALDSSSSISPHKEQPSVPTLTGQFQDVNESPAVSVCSLPDTSLSLSDPVTTPAATSSPDVATATVTSSFQSNNKVAITFSVPVLSVSTTNSNQNIISQALATDAPLQDSVAMATSNTFNGSFGGGNANSSFDQGGFPSEGAVIVTEGAIGCQLASSLTNTSAHSIDGGANDSVNDDMGIPSGVVKKYLCEHQGCTKAYRYKKDVIRHMKMKHGSQPSKYEQKEIAESFMRKHACSQCTKMYAHRKDLLRHQRDVHSPDAMVRREAMKANQKRYPCEYPNCHKYYVHKKDLIRHRRNDHNDTTETKDMHIPEPVSPSQLSPGPTKRQRTWSSGGTKVANVKPETAAEPTSVPDSEMQWVSVVKEGNVAAAMATSDAGTLESGCALFNTTTANSEATTSLISLLSVTPPADGTSTASVHPLFSAVTSVAQDTPTPTENNINN